MADSLRVHLFEILVGNSDFSLEVYNSRIFPTSVPFFAVKNIAITRESKAAQLKPLAYDFHVALVVTVYEQSEPSKPWAQLPILTSDAVTASMAREILRLRMMAKESDLQMAYQPFLASKESLLKSEKIPPWFERSRAISMRIGSPLVILGEEKDFTKPIL